MRFWFKKKEVSSDCDHTADLKEIKNFMIDVKNLLTNNSDITMLSEYIGLLDNSIRELYNLICENISEETNKTPPKQLKPVKPIPESITKKEPFISAQEKEKMYKILDEKGNTPLNDLRMSIRCVTILSVLGVKKLSDIVKKKEEEIYMAKGGSEAVVNEIKALLKEYGLALNLN